MANLFSAQLSNCSLIQMTLKTGYDRRKVSFPFWKILLAAFFSASETASSRSVKDARKCDRDRKRRRRRAKLLKVKVEFFVFFCSRSLKYARKCDWTGRRERRRRRAKLPKRLRPFVRFSDSQIGQQSQLT